MKKTLGNRVIHQGDSLLYCLGRKTLAKKKLLQKHLNSYVHYLLYKNF